MPATASDPRFLCPRRFLEMIHGGRAAWGNIGWARRIDGVLHDHHPRPFAEVAAAMEELAGQDDVYMTLNRFRRWRRCIEEVGQLAALHVDVDWYRVLPAATTAEHAVQLILGALDDAGLPAPSFILDTGRGSLAVWLIDPVPARIRGQEREGPIRRWRAMQERLCKALAPLGSDRSQCHAAAICRVPGTRNGKSGRPVRLVWKSSGTDRYTFEELAEEILPPRPANRPPPSRHRTGDPPRAVPASCRGPRNLHIERLHELRRWAHSQEQIPDGVRDHFIFCAAVSLAWTVEIEMLPGAIVAFAQETGLLDIPGWSRRRVSQVTGAVVRRAKRDAHQGGTGEAVSRYRLRRQTIIEQLGITSAQARRLDLKQLDPDEERRQQRRREGDRQRQEHRRRRQGASTRDDYLAGSLTSKKPWEALGMSRAAWYKKGLHRLPGAKEEQTKSVA